MLLRASGLSQNRDYDLNAVTGAAVEDAGVPHGRSLMRFAEAVLDEDEAVLSRARTELLRALGPEGLVDAAAVVGLFNAIDRVAAASRLRPRRPRLARISAPRSASAASLSAPAPDR